MDYRRFKKQLDFILEIDKLKSIFRQSYLLNGERRENDSEHSWHLAMMAILLFEYANEKVDILHVIKMVLIHDIVEIDAGDTYCYDDKGNLDKADRENSAAKRLFGILPSDLGEELNGLWREFEDKKTPEAKFAGSLDRLMPMLHNFHTKGISWKEHGIKKEQVLERNAPIKDGSIELWEFVKKEIIEKAVDLGYLQG